MNQTGFTLIEVLVTVTFIAIASAAIIEIFISVERLNRQARNYTIVTQLAQQKVESYRNLAFGNIPASEDFTTSLPGNLGSPKSATTSFEDLTPAKSGLKQLNIAIYYTEGNTRKDIQVTTLITERGIDR